MTLNDAQVTEIETMLGGIVGLPLVAASLYSPGPTLWFDEPRRLGVWGVRPAGGRALWTLKADCPWSLEGPDGPIWAEGRPWEISSDECARLARLVDAQRAVTSAAVRRDGALRILLENNHALLVWPAGPFDLESETKRTDLRWSLGSPDDDPRGTLSLRLGRLTREPMPEPPQHRVAYTEPETDYVEQASRNVTSFGGRFWDEA